MVDQDLTVWLIECNTNPCLDESSSLLRNILPRMVDDALKLTIDKVFKSSAEIKVQELSELKANKYQKMPESPSKRFTISGARKFLTGHDPSLVKPDSFNP